MKFEHQISENLSHIGPDTEGLYCFHCTLLNFDGNFTGKIELTT